MGILFIYSPTCCKLASLPELLEFIVRMVLRDQSACSGRRVGGSSGVHGYLDRHGSVSGCTRLNLIDARGHILELGFLLGQLQH